VSCDRIDYRTPAGQVRLLIADVNPEAFIVEESQVQGLLALTSGNVRRAAARALRMIAASEVLISKKITTQDLSTDGPAVAAELRAQAKDLEAEADAVDAKTDVITDAYASFTPNVPVHGVEAAEWRR